LLNRKLSEEEIKERQEENYFDKDLFPWKGQYKAIKNCKNLNDFFHNIEVEESEKEQSKNNR